MQHYSGRVVGVAPVPAAAALQSVRAPVVGGIPWRSHITRIVVVVSSVYLAPHQIHWFGSSVAVVVPRSAPPVVNIIIRVLVWPPISSFLHRSFGGLSARAAVASV